MLCSRPYPDFSRFLDNYPILERLLVIYSALLRHPGMNISKLSKFRALCVQLTDLDRSGKAVLETLSPTIRHLVRNYQLIHRLDNEASPERDRCTCKCFLILYSDGTTLRTQL